MMITVSNAFNTAERLHAAVSKKIGPNKSVSLQFELFEVENPQLDIR